VILSHICSTLSSNTTAMISSRILRNIGATGNRLMNEAGPKERTMLYAAGALAGLTGLVYWAGYKAQGSTHRNKKPLNASEASPLKDAK